MNQAAATIEKYNNRKSCNNREIALTHSQINYTQMKMKSTAYFFSFCIKIEENL